MTQQDVITSLNDLDYLCAEFIHHWNISPLVQGEQAPGLMPYKFQSMDHSNQIPDVLWIEQAQQLVNGLKAEELDAMNAELQYVQIASKPGKKGPKASPGS